MHAILWRMCAGDGAAIQVGRRWQRKAKHLERGGGRGGTILGSDQLSLGQQVHPDRVPDVVVEKLTVLRRKGSPPCLRRRDLKECCPWEMAARWRQPAGGDESH